MEMEKRFNQIAQEYKAVIFKVCYMYAQDENQINDYYQEILLRIWLGLPKFKGDCSLSTWVYRISINTCISDLRQKKRRPSYESMHIDMPVFDEDQEKAQQIKELYILINKLEKLERALILLWLEELSYDEISEIMGLSKSLVGVKLMRVKNKLKELINK